MLSYAPFITLIKLKKITKKCLHLLILTIRDNKVNLIEDDTFGGMVEITCKENKDGEKTDLSLTVFDLPMFEPWFVFALVFIGMLLFIIKWFRR